jgi:hypothetical protein
MGEEGIGERRTSGTKWGGKRGQMGVMWCREERRRRRRRKEYEGCAGIQNEEISKENCRGIGGLLTIYMVIPLGAMMEHKEGAARGDYGGKKIEPKMVC